MTSADKDEVHAALLKRAHSTSRALTLLVIVTALGTSLGALYLTVGGAEAGGILLAKLVGATGGLTFVAAFATTLLAGIALTRHVLVSRLRAWTADAVAQHSLEAGELDYIVAMYEKPNRRADLEEP